MKSSFRFFKASSPSAILGVSIAVQATIQVIAKKYYEARIQPAGPGLYSIHDEQFKQDKQPLKSPAEEAASSPSNKIKRSP